MSDDTHFLQAEKDSSNRGTKSYRHAGCSCCRENLPLLGFVAAVFGEQVWQYVPWRQTNMALKVAQIKDKAEKCSRANWDKESCISSLLWQISLMYQIMYVYSHCIRTPGWVFMLLAAHCSRIGIPYAHIHCLFKFKFYILMLTTPPLLNFVWLCTRNSFFSFSFLKSIYFTFL